MWIPIFLLFHLWNIALSVSDNVKMEACASVKCGSVNISYPFWISKTQPEYCGYPSLEINCQDDKPFLVQSYDTNYYIDRVFYDNSSFVLINSILVNGNTNCSVPHFNVSLGLGPMVVSKNNKELVFFFDCGKVEPLPFVFFTDPELTPVLAGTLVSACFCSDQNRGVVLQELSTEMLLTVLKSCKQGLLDSPALFSSTMNQPSDASQILPEVKPSLAEVPIIRQSRRAPRTLAGKGGTSASVRLSRAKVQRDGRVTRACDEWALKHAFPASEPSVSFLLHRRFPIAFLDKAEDFFSKEA